MSSLQVHHSFLVLVEDRLEVIPCIGEFLWERKEGSGGGEGSEHSDPLLGFHTHEEAVSPREELSELQACIFGVSDSVGVGEVGVGDCGSLVKVPWSELGYGNVSDKAIDTEGGVVGENEGTILKDRVVALLHLGSVAICDVFETGPFFS